MSSDLFDWKREPRTFFGIGFHWPDIPLQSVKGGESSKLTHFVEVFAIWVSRKTFLRGSITWLRYVNTSLRSYLSIESIGKVVRHVVGVLSHPKVHTSQMVTYWNFCSYTQCVFYCSKKWLFSLKKSSFFHKKILFFFNFKVMFRRR